jgi:hypothetical protein
MTIGQNYTWNFASNSSFAGSGVTITVKDSLTNTVITSEGITLNSSGSGSYTFSSSTTVYPNGKNVQVTFTFRPADTYNFKVWGDDNCKVFVDGVKIVESGYPGTAEANNITISSGLHSVKIENTNIDVIPLGGQNTWESNPAYFAAHIYASNGTRIFSSGQLLTATPTEGPETFVVRLKYNNEVKQSVVVTVVEGAIPNSTNEVYTPKFDKTSINSNESFTFTVDSQNVSSGRTVSVAFTGDGVASFVKKSDDTSPPSTLSIVGNGVTGSASVQLKLGSGYNNTLARTLTATISVDGVVKGSTTLNINSATAVSTTCSATPNVLVTLPNTTGTYGRIMTNAVTQEIELGEGVGSAGIVYSGLGGTVAPKIRWNNRIYQLENDSGATFKDAALKFYKDSPTPTKAEIIIDANSNGRVEYVLCPNVDSFTSVTGTSPFMNKSAGWGTLLKTAGVWHAVPYIQTMTEAAYGPYIPGNSSSPYQQIPGATQPFNVHNESIVISYREVANLPAGDYVLVRQMYNGWFKTSWSTDNGATWTAVGRLPATGLAKDQPYCYTANSGKEADERCIYRWRHNGGTLLWKYETKLTADADPFGAFVSQMFTKEEFDSVLSVGPEVGPCEQSQLYGNFIKTYGVWYKNNTTQLGNLTKEYELTVTSAGQYEVVSAVDDNVKIYFRTPPGNWTLFSDSAGTFAYPSGNIESINLPVGKHYLRFSANNTGGPGAIAILIRKQGTQEVLFDTRGYQATQLSPTFSGILNTVVYDPQAGIEEALASDSGWAVSQRFQGGRTSYSQVLASGVSYVGDGTTYGYTSATGPNVLNSQTNNNMVTGSVQTISQNYALVPYQNLGTTGTALQDLLGTSNS